jgi:hypothetical protein
MASSTGTRYSRSGFVLLVRRISYVLAGGWGWKMPDERCPSLSREAVRYRTYLVCRSRSMTMRNQHIFPYDHIDPAVKVQRSHRTRTYRYRTYCRITSSTPLVPVAGTWYCRKEVEKRICPTYGRYDRTWHGRKEVEKRICPTQMNWDRIGSCNK